MSSSALVSRSELFAAAMKRSSHLMKPVAPLVSTVSSSSTTPSLRCHDHLSSMSIQSEIVEHDPESLKFVPGMIKGRRRRNVAGFENPFTFLDGSENNNAIAARRYSSSPYLHPLVKNLFTVDGVQKVSLGNDHVTVTKSAELDWEQMRKHIFSVILDHISIKMDTTAVAPTNTLDEEFVNNNNDHNYVNREKEEDARITTMVQQILESKIQPVLQEDGIKNVRLLNFDNETGIAFVGIEKDLTRTRATRGTNKMLVAPAGWFMLLHWVYPEENFAIETVIESLLIQSIPNVTGVIIEEEVVHDTNNNNENISHSDIIKNITMNENGILSANNSDAFNYLIHSMKTGNPR